MGANRSWRVWRLDSDGWVQLDGRHPSYDAAARTILENPQAWGSLYCVLRSGDVPPTDVGEAA